MLTLSYQYDYIPNDIYSVFYDKDKMGNVSLPQLEADYTRQISLPAPMSIRPSLIT